MNDSKEPLFEALEALAGKNPFRFHMPGHKGLLPPPLDGAARIDFTELDGTGNLYTEEDGAIRASEALTAKLYGAESCLYLTGGATQGIFAMLASVCSPGDAVLIDRASHRSVYNALCLLDLEPVYIRRRILRPFGVGGGLEPPDVPAGRKPACMLVTTPSYYGVLSDVPALAAYCQRLGVPLLLDCAHGAHLPFAMQGFRPDALQGAAMAVFSAHKTLSALGQAAFLLIGGGQDAERVRYMTSVFGTSSPSYPILASLDRSQAGLRGGGGWDCVCRAGLGLREKYPALLGAAVETDPARLCLYTGDGYRAALRFEREHGVFCEMADENNVVFILSPNDTPSAMAALESAIASVGAEMPEVFWDEPLPLPKRELSPRQAFFARKKTVRLADSAGLVAGSMLAPYPPGSPLVAAGEILEQNVLEILLKMCYTHDDAVQVCV